MKNVCINFSLAVGKIDFAAEDGAADRSPQPAISNAWPRAFAIEKRSKDAIGPRKLPGGVHN